MPTIRTIAPGGAIEPRPTATPRREKYQIPQLQTPPGPIAPDASALGAGFGGTIANIGEAFYANELQKQDQIRVAAAEKQLTDWYIPNMYSPDGAMSVQGEHALGLPDKMSYAYDRQVS